MTSGQWSDTSEAVKVNLLLGLTVSMLLSAQDGMLRDWVNLSGVVLGRLAQPMRLLLRVLVLSAAGLVTGVSADAALSVLLKRDLGNAGT